MRRSLSFYILLILLHAFIGVSLIPPMHLGAAGVAVGVLLLAASVVLVPLGMRAPSLRRGRWSEPLTWAALIAMGYLSSLLVLTILRDIVLFGFDLFGHGNPAVARDSAVAVPLAALAVTLVGFVNARRVAKVVKVDVPIEGLPAQLHGYSIAQISDIHVGPTIKRPYLNAIVNRVNGLKADAIAITGDLVDGSVRRLALHTEPLGRLSAPDGTFFVTGNHEYYSGAQEWIAEMRKLGLTVLINEHVVRERGGAGVMIAGVPDFTAHYFVPDHRSDPAAAAEGAPDNVQVRILLAHQPRTALEAAEAGYHLQLSGHTHGGQFFPWNLFVPLQQPFVAGLKRVQDMWVYISRGTGYWGPPKRFGAPSEITLVRLVQA